MINKTFFLLIKTLIKPFVNHKIKNFENIKTIAVLKSGALGDVLMTTPFLKVLRKKFPEAKIDYWVGEWSCEALKNNKKIDEIRIVKDKYFHSMNPFTSLKFLMLLRANSYDLMFVLDKSFLAGLMALFSEAKVRIGFDRFGEGFANNLSVRYDSTVKHEIEYYKELAYLTGAKKTNDVQIEINTTKEDEIFAQKIFEENKISIMQNTKKIIGIAPGGGKNPGIGTDKLRVWPEEKFYELIKELQKKYCIILFGGKTDIELCERLLKKTNKTRRLINLAGKLTIQQTSALMRKCQLIITNDAGPMHIASASNKKVISIFGPTNPLRKAPLNKESKVIWKDQDIYDDKADIYGLKFIKERKFMKKISVEEVLRVVEEVKNF